MIKLEEYLATHELNTDEYGRIIIEDMALLDQINGAFMSGSEFLFSDGACGNSNCVC